MRGAPMRRARAPKATSRSGGRALPTVLCPGLAGPGPGTDLNCAPDSGVDESSVNSPPTPPREFKLQLFCRSFVGLFLEMMLVRVPPVVHLVAYYANLMLLSSFLGLGVGAPSPLAVTKTRPALPTAARARPGLAENSREAIHFVVMDQVSCTSSRTGRTEKPPL
jgi:hypothetical protein